MLFFNAHTLVAVLVIVTSALLATFSSASSIGKCCKVNTECSVGCVSIDGQPAKNTKHDLGANCKSFQPAVDALSICSSHDCRLDCYFGVIKPSDCLNSLMYQDAKRPVALAYADKDHHSTHSAENGSFGCVRF